MYMHGLKQFDCGCAGQTLQGLGSQSSDNAAKTAAMLVADYYTGGTAGFAMGASGGGGSDGGSGAPPLVNTNAVSTSVNTQVSPQISPNFIQQQQPTNSAVNASTSANPSQSVPGLPTVPMTGMIPGFDNAPPSYPVYAPTATVRPLSTTLMYGALGAMAIALAVKFSRRRAA